MVVEDDETLSRALCRLLNRWGFEAADVENFDNVVEEFLECRPDLVLMDLYLPRYNGLHWTAQIRRHSSVPVLFLSSASENVHMISALTQGADDYILKPADPDLLIKKIEAMLRRSYDYQVRSSWLEHNGLKLDLDCGTAEYNGQSVELSKNETRILKVLMENKGTIVSRDDLMESLWKTSLYIDENTLSVNVNRLRRKLDSIGKAGMIETKKGLGYKI